MLSSHLEVSSGTWSCEKVKILDIIPFQFKIESTLSGVNKAIVDEERIYCMDKGRKKLVVFDLEGNLLFSIGPSGRGPGESQGVKDFSLMNQRIVILSNIPSKLLYYDFEGSLVEEVNIDYKYYRSISYMRERNLFLVTTHSSDTRELIGVMNTKGEVIEYFFEKDELHEGYTSFMDWSTKNIDGIEYMFNGINNTIYQIITPDSIVPYFSFSNGIGVPKDIIRVHNKYTDNFTKLSDIYSKYFKIIDWWITDQYVFYALYSDFDSVIPIIFDRVRSKYYYPENLENMSFVDKFCYWGPTYSDDVMYKFILDQENFMEFCTDFGIKYSDYGISQQFMIKYELDNQVE